ncbi:MAG: hypothetical protein AABW72_03070 [archaeon]
MGFLMKKCFNEKGQIATEYVISMGVLLAVVAVITSYSFLTYAETMKMQNLSTSLEALGNAAKYVHAAGSGNSMLTKIKIPEGVISSSILGNKLSITWKGSDFTYALDFNLSGSLPIAEGIYTMRVYANDASVAFQAI